MACNIKFLKEQTHLLADKAQDHFICPLRSEDETIQPYSIFLCGGFFNLTSTFNYRVTHWNTALALMTERNSCDAHEVSVITMQLVAYRWSII